MHSVSLSSLRDLLVERGHELTFADLPGTVLEDLALGWRDGRSIARAAAELLTRIDGIPARGRERQLAGRALLALLARRGARIEVLVPADHARLLGDPAVDDGDPEAEAAFARRTEEYADLARLPQEYTLEEYAADLGGAFDFARTESRRGEDLPPDPIARAHPLALLHYALPPGLRAWFHDRYPPHRADVLAWKFVLVGRALARHRAGMLADGVLGPETDRGVPERLVAALLALDLGELARTAILDPDA